MKKKLMIIGGIVLGVLVIVLGIYIYITSTSSRLVCKSSLGNVRLVYNDKELIRYSTTGSISYDYDVQTARVEKVGIESYIEEFTEWFETTTDGTCVKR